MTEFVPAAKVYYERIKIVKSDWKVNIDFERNQELNDLEIPIASDIDFSNFIWPGTNEDMSDGSTSLMASINFYEVFGS